MYEALRRIASKPLIDPRQGLATATIIGSRFWHEVNVNKICFNANSISSSIESRPNGFLITKEELDSGMETMVMY